MGCCQSTTATSSGVRGRTAAGRSHTAFSVTEDPVLTEVTARERALAELARLFEGVNANELGHASTAELKASLEGNGSIMALLKEAGMNEFENLVNQLVWHQNDFVSWEDFQQYAQTAYVHDVSGEKVVKRLKEVFDSLAADHDGAVGKIQLVAKLNQDTNDVNGMDGDSIGKLVGNAHFAPVWNALEKLVTKKDGCITWEELKAHIRGAANEAGEVEDIAVTQSCWGCC